MKLRNLLIYISLLFATIVGKADSIGSYNSEGRYVALLPWNESFDNYGSNYDGTSALPNGWMASGDVPFRTAYSRSMNARTGTYYMVTESSPNYRNDRAYTPFFDLKSGESYTFRFFLWMPGDNVYGSDNKLLLTSGLEQDFEFQTDTLLTINEVASSWTEYSVTIKPENDELRCFCFHLLTETPLCGMVGIEDVSLLAEGQQLPPSADFAIDGNMDIMTDYYMQFPGSHLHLINKSNYGSSYQWIVNGGTLTSATDEHTDVSFDQAGTYTIQLNTSNSAGSQTCTRTVNVGYYDQANTYLGVQNYNGTYDKLLARGEVPTFSTDPINDFWTGPNHYYNTLAERFELPETISMDVNSVSYFLTNFSMLASNSSTTWPVQKDVKVTFSLVGETNGLPDERKIFGQMSGPLSVMVADRGIGVGQMKEFRFAQPIRVHGTFYAVLDFDKDFCVDSPDINLGRSYFGMSPSFHESGRASMYVKPHHNIDGTLTDNTWKIATDFYPEMKGIGLVYTIWGTMQEPDLTNISLQNATPVLTYPCFSLDGLSVGSKTHGGIIINNSKKIISR